MAKDLWSMLFVLVALGVLIGVFAFLRRRDIVDGELSRKAVHMGMGCITVCFPWLFERSWPVGLLALLACGAILAMARVPFLRSALRDIDRQSGGELYFPLAVAFAFHYAKGNPILYCPPILMLTFGDALAALIGKRFGVSFYATHEGRKTWEGSLAFLIASFLTTFASLALLSDFSVAKLALVALLLGIVGFMIEGFAWRGLDNFFVPVFGLFAMEAFHLLEVSSLLIRVIVVVALLGFCFACKKQSTMNDSALFGSVLILYLVWALAGWQWALAPLLVFLLFTQVVPIDHGQYRNYQSVTALVAINVVPLFWLAQAIRATNPTVFIWPYTLSLAIHLVAIWCKRAKTQARRPLRLLALLAFPAIGVVAVQLVPLSALQASGVAVLSWIPLAVSLLACAGASLLLLAVRKFDFQGSLSFEEWSFRNALSFAGSFVVLAFI